MKNYLLDERLFQYPESFKKCIELNLVDFDIWYLLDSEWGPVFVWGIAGKVPNQKVDSIWLKRGDCDDTACFEIGKGNKVQLIHDFATEDGSNEKSLTIFGNGWNMR